MALFELNQSYENAPVEWQRPTFKDCVARDIDLAFFNGDEHAEKHHVDDKKDVLVVLQEDDARGYNSHWEWGKKGRMDDGLYLLHAILHIRVKDYGPKPKTGKELVLDAGTDHKRTYRILHCQEENGVYRMTLERARQ